MTVFSTFSCFTVFSKEKDSCFSRKFKIFDHRLSMTSILHSSSGKHHMPMIASSTLLRRFCRIRREATQTREQVGGDIEDNRAVICLSGMPNTIVVFVVILRVGMRCNKPSIMNNRTRLYQEAGQARYLEVRHNRSLFFSEKY